LRLKLSRSLQNKFCNIYLHPFKIRRQVPVVSVSRMIHIVHLIQGVKMNADPARTAARLHCKLTIQWLSSAVERTTSVDAQLTMKAPSPSVFSHALKSSVFLYIPANFRRPANFTPLKDYWFLPAVGSTRLSNKYQWLYSGSKADHHQHRH
jgi:hypothetical protein